MIKIDRSKINVGDAWKKYFKAKNNGIDDTESRNQLILYYYPLLYSIADKLKIKDIPLEDRISMGLNGLYDAISKYDESYNNKFETYATWRIRGSIFDAARKLDWVPRLVRSRYNEIENFRQICESEEGRKLTNHELAERMGMSYEEYEKYANSAVAKTVTGAYENHSSESDNQIGIDHMEDHRITQPVDHMIRKELFAKLLGRNFSSEERKIIWLYYYLDRTMKEIAETTNLSESRVSQQHARILNRLRNKVKVNPEYYNDIETFIPKLKGVLDSV